MQIYGDLELDIFISPLYNLLVIITKCRIGIKLGITFHLHLPVSNEYLNRRAGQKAHTSLSTVMGRWMWEDRREGKWKHGFCDALLDILEMSRKGIYTKQLPPKRLQV